MRLFIYRVIVERHTEICLSTVPVIVYPPLFRWELSDWPNSDKALLFLSFISLLLDMPAHGSETVLVAKNLGFQ